MFFISFIRYMCVDQKAGLAGTCKKVAFWVVPGLVIKWGKFTLGVICLNRLKGACDDFNVERKCS